MIRSLLVIGLILSGCTFTEYKRVTGDGVESVSVSNKSFGMNRENLFLSKESGKIQVGIGSSDGTTGIDKSIKLLEAAKELKP